jgi:hypothetical protein
MYEHFTIVKSKDSDNGFSIIEALDDLAQLRIINDTPRFFTYD